MKVLCAFGRHAYGDPARGEGYEHANFIPGLQELGHEVELFDTLERSAYPDFAALNRAFLARVAAFRPDVVLCVPMHYELWTETLDALQGSSSAALICWGTDDSWKYGQFARFMAPHFDLYATTSAAALEQARADGLASVVLSQWAANAASLAAPLAARDCRYPVSFVGAAYGNRRKWVAALAARGVVVQCFGHGWPNGPVSTADMRRIVRESVVSLNFGDSGLHWRGLRAYRSRQIKARIFEIPGAGGFLLTEPAEGLGDYYRIGPEIDVFSSPDEAAAKVQGYLADPEKRDRMAQAAHARTRTEHTYAKRFMPLLEEAMRRRAARPADPPGRAFDQVAAGHAPSPWLRNCLAGPAALLFGPRRGPRAARRLVFECSWRLAGASTYSARGWPGRLFYRES